MQTQTNSDFPFKAGGTYVEKWVSGSNAGNASVVQTLTNLPAGTYKLKAGAQNLLQSNNVQCSSILQEDTDSVSEVVLNIMTK